MSFHRILAGLVFTLGATNISSAWALQGDPAPPGKETTIPDYKLWIPDAVTTVRGIIAVSNHEAGADIYRDSQTYGTMRGKTLGYRDLARRMGLALFLFKKFTTNNYVVGNQKLVTDALSELAALSGHPEVRTAGLLPTGLSAGGWYSGWLAQYNPARVIGFFPIAGAPEAFASMADLRKIPSLYINQGRDAFYPGSGVDTQKVALAGRRNGALWGGHVTSRDVEHHNIYKHDAIIVWLEDIIPLRVPANLPAGMPPTFNVLNESDGFLVDMKTHDTNGKAPVIVDSVTVYKFSEAPGDKGALLWMPTERSARALADYLAGDGHLPEKYRIQSSLPPVVLTVTDGGAPDGRSAMTAVDGGATGAGGKAGMGGTSGAGGAAGGGASGSGGVTAGGSGVGGNTSASSMRDAAAAAGSSSAGGNTSPSAPTPEDPLASPNAGGCACHVSAPGGAPSALAFGALGLALAFLLRRR